MRGRGKAFPWADEHQHLQLRDLRPPAELWPLPPAAAGGGGGLPVLPHPSPTGVVIAGVGRSGSTLLARLLATVPQTFLFSEPYMRWTSACPDSCTPRLALPSLASILDCSAFSDPPTFQKLMWIYACDFSRILPASMSDGETEGFWTRCRTNSLTEADRQTVHGFCLASPLRVVKTIRLHEPGIAASLDGLDTATTAAAVRVELVLLSRNPVATFFSQYKQGWYGDIWDYQSRQLSGLLSPSEAKAPAASPAVRTAAATFWTSMAAKPRQLFTDGAQDICRIMNSNYDHVAALASLRLHRIRLEDLTPELRGVAEGKLSHIQSLDALLTLTPEQARYVAKRVTSQRHASFPARDIWAAKALKERKLQTALLTDPASNFESDMAALPTCHTAYTTYQYS